MRFILTGMQHDPNPPEHVLDQAFIGCREYIFAELYSGGTRIDASTISIDDYFDNAEAIEALYEMPGLAGSSSRFAQLDGATLTIARIGIPTTFLFFNIVREPIAS